MTSRFSLKVVVLPAVLLVGVLSGSVVFSQPGPRGGFVGRAGMSRRPMGGQPMGGQPMGGGPQAFGFVPRSQANTFNAAGQNMNGQNGFRQMGPGQNQRAGNPMGQGGRPMQPPQPSAVQTPLAALEAGLNLTPEQAAEIQNVQEEFKQQCDAVLSQSMQSNSSSTTPAARQAGMNQARVMEQQANQAISNMLTSEQQQALPALLQQLQAWRMAGLPAELYGDLNLTADQQQQIAALAQRRGSARNGSARQGRNPVSDMLTAEQQGIVQAFWHTHPRP